MNNNLKWTSIVGLITIILLGGILILTPKDFTINYENGYKAKYKENVFKLYNGRYLELISEPSVECYTKGAYRRTNKVTRDGVKYSDLLYAEDQAGYHHVMQKVQYGQGELERYFKLDKRGQTKEIFKFTADDPNMRCRLRLRYCNIDAPKQMLLDAKRTVVKSNVEVGERGYLNIDWEAEIDKTSRVEIFGNGCLQILTRPQTGVIYYDPKIKNQNKSKGEIAPVLIDKQEMWLSQFKGKNVELYSTGELSDVSMRFDGKNIIFNIAPMNNSVKSIYEATLSPEDLDIFQEKGIKIDAKETKLDEFNNTIPKYAYISSNGGSISFDLAKLKSGTIGYATAIFNITDLFWGTNEGNISIDTTAELKPSITTYTPPQSGNIIGRWDFENDCLTDTSGFNKNMSNLGDVVHEHERCVFNSSANGLKVTNDTHFKVDDSFALIAWVDFTSNSVTNSRIVKIANGDDYIELYRPTGTGNVNFIGRNTSDPNIIQILGTTNISDGKPHLLIGQSNGIVAEFYIDNILIGNDTSVGGVHIPDGPDTFIGTHSTGGSVWEGNIESVWIYNGTTLNATERELIWNNTMFDTQGGIRNYTGLFTSGYIDSGVNETTWNSITFSETIFTGTDIEYRARIGNLTTPLCNSTGLVEEWLLNSTIELQGCLNAINGTGSGGIQNISGIAEKDGAIRFDGIDDKITVPNTGELNVTGTDPFSVEALFKVFNVSDLNQEIFGDFQTSGGTRFTVAADQLLFSIRNGSATVQAQFSVVGRNNEWIHAVGVFNGTTTLLYIDGILKKTNDIPAGYIIGQTTETVHSIGYSANSDAYLNGSIDYIAFYNKTLNADEVSNLSIKWNSYTAYTSDSNITLNQDGHKLQFQALLKTSNNTLTPILINYSSITVFNTPPNITSIKLNMTSIFNYSTDNLTLNYTIIDIDSDPITVLIQWFKDNVVQNSIENLTILSSNNVSEGQKWYACTTPNDGTVDGTTRCSFNVTILWGNTVAINDNVSLIFKLRDSINWSTHLIYTFEFNNTGIGINWTGNAASTMNSTNKVTPIISRSSRLSPSLSRIAKIFLGAFVAPFHYTNNYWIGFAIRVNQTQNNLTSADYIQVNLGNITQKIINQKLNGTSGLSFGNMTGRLYAHYPGGGCVDYNTTDAINCTSWPYEIVNGVSP